ncbi:DUF2946 family protein [Rhodalgimonas zhirmunskyi]|uniref:DUF2946 family protein n=1 Tax=Rhodalgimonas zhirmunskyi TaxID=2964767 RepID=A0AAJ1UA69_9RHOB|nr:DUF2946 family protein [Rhodoalgimonas zhirmunskyi]MDQ2094068.1 DUF2946 family protein [Rhodoalgimonas zhirmunskyi]
MPDSLRLAGLITRALLFLALLGSATMPTGLMRAQGPDGMQLVLCTPDGTKEVWLTNDGEVRPVDEHQPGSGDHNGGDHNGPHCVQVSVANAEAPPQVSSLIPLLLWPVAPPAITAQRPASQALLSRHRSRAPPVPV